MIPAVHPISAGTVSHFPQRALDTHLGRAPFQAIRPARHKGFEKAAVFCGTLLMQSRATFVQPPTDIHTTLLQVLQSKLNCKCIDAPDVLRPLCIGADDDATPPSLQRIG